ncbi:MAG: DUF1611 domain-containing protein [Candidatus Thermoplasmatota archaeon]|nr:DUF1611 domain-containing protein [Candidatus Thermoplasmatota archaeon]MBS3790263.1 DUF1611 domain-containing protein [Candidatus Thermoplasmatota archaeon]
MFDIDEKIPALIYAEGEFGRIDGKTANGLVRFSKKYEIVGVLDSTRQEEYVSEVLEDVGEKIPIFNSLEQALEKLDVKPEAFINGIARDGGAFPYDRKEIFFKAMENGMDIVHGCHDHISEEKEFKKKMEKYGVDIWDVRKEPEDQHFFTGKLRDIDDPPRILVSGTDCAIGKRTFCIELYKELEDRGYNPAFVATGQTGMIQGAKYGFPLDGVRGDFLSGETEHVVWEASTDDDHDVVIVEGQACIVHPQGGNPLGLMKGVHPHGVVLIHAPGRKEKDGLLEFDPPDLDKEKETIEFFYPNSVISIGINHENGIDVDEWIKKYEDKYGVPAEDALLGRPTKTADKIEKEFINGQPKVERAR